MDHLVVGAGIVGVSIADALVRDGAKVLVVDKGRIGAGCSKANAGWVTPCFAMPLPRPGGQRSFERGTAALVELSRYSLDAYAELDAHVRAA